MSNISLCWELGGGHGHIAGFQPLSQKLLQRGHQVSAFLRNTEHCEWFLDTAAIEIETAPYMTAKIQPKSIVSYADILIRLGYGSCEAVLARVQQWCKLFKKYNTRLIIADHSPTALLAAKCMGIPAVDYGNGFFSPPKIYPIPGLTPWIKTSEEELKEIENKVVQTINQVLRFYNTEEINCLYELFDIEENFLCTFAELDHYKNRPEAEYWGPVFSIDKGIDAQWPDNQRKNLFVYIKHNYKHLDLLLSSLSKMEVNSLVYCNGLSRDTINTYSSDKLKFSSEPIKISSLQSKADLIINNAGHGTVAACLLMGLPQLLLPMQLEQLVLSDKLAHTQLAEIMVPRDNPNFAEKIMNTLENRPLHQTVMRLAQYYYGFNPVEQIEEMVLCCEDILQG